MLRFITHVSADEYWFDGTFMVPGSAAGPKPLLVTGTFLIDNGDLIFEGSCRLSQGSTAHPFSARVTANYANAAAVAVCSLRTGNLTGNICAVGQAFEFLATAPTGAAMSMHVELLDGHALRATGSMATPDGSLCFSASGLPGEERGSLGNVVSIHGGRRA